MSEPIDGGQAFPQMAYSASESQIYGRDTFVPRDGMSLRDYFAAKAMQSFAHYQLKAECDIDDAQVATWAYKIADAMLLERAKQ